MYGNASTQLLEFDANGKFLREIGKGVYGLGYGHGIRYDKYDNLWVVDKGVHTAVRFNPAGYVTLNLGRRPEGPDEPEWYRPLGPDAKPPTHVDGYFRGPTDVAFDGDDNVYISDGYTNSRVAKFDKNGNWVKSWGQRGPSGAHANENPGSFNTPHNIGVDRQNNVYVADRNNRRIQVFDRDGNFVRYLLLNVAYDKKRHPVLGDVNPNAPDETQPWTICITNTPTQYLYTSDSEPGRVYKLTLDGKILGWFGESGRGPKQFNWIHSDRVPFGERAAHRRHEQLARAEGDAAPRSDRLTPSRAITRMPSASDENRRRPYPSAEARPWERPGIDRRRLRGARCRACHDYV